MEAMHIKEWLDIELSEMFDTLHSNTETEFEVSANITEIPHESCSGFIPFTNGGIHLIAPIALDYLVSTGKGFVNKDITNEIDKTVEYCYTGAREQFIAENREALNPLFTTKMLDTNSDEINYHNLYDLDEGSLAEDLSLMESGWLEGTLFVEHRAQFYAADNHRNETGHDEICFMSGVNLDYDYGRDKGLNTTYEQTFKVKDLTPAVLETILKNMLQSI
jgi:hypothetical protein